VIAREKQRKLVGSGAITDGETDAKNASVDGPLETVAGRSASQGLIKNFNKIKNQTKF
jgi:hypothetical protein